MFRINQGQISFKRDQVLRGRAIILAATLIVSGFFIFNAVFAAHTATVTLDKIYTQNGPATSYTFAINKTSGDDLQYVYITIPTGFTYTSAVCPFDWPAVWYPAVSQLKCDGEFSTNYITTSASVVLTVAPPAIDGVYSWIVKTKDINGTMVALEPLPTTTVDNTAPVVSIDTVTTPTQISTQAIIGTFTEVNIDNITVNGNPAVITDSTYSAIITLNEGSNTVNVVATDKVGLTGNASTIIVLDTTPPSTFDDGTDDWTKGDESGNVTITLTATDGDAGSGVAHTYYTTDGTTPTTLSTEYTGLFTISTEGEHQLMYFSVDNAGNPESPVTGTLIKIDKTNPITTFTITPVLPDGNIGWHVTVPAITLSCTDQVGLSGCDKIFYRWGDSGSFVEYTIAPISAPEGDTNLNYYSTDIAGNQEDAKSENIKVDITDPTITDDAPFEWKNTDVTVILSPSDSGSNIGQVLYCEGSACTPSVPLISPYQLNYSAEGQTTVRYEAIDNAGNVSAIGEYIIRIDTTDPTTGVSGAPTNWANVDQTATVTCSDSGGSDCDTSSYKLQVLTSELASCSTNVSDYTVVNPATISQHSWVCSYVKDIAGNEDFSDTVSEFKVDKIAPTGGLTGVPTAWQNTDASIGLTGSDLGDSTLVSQFLNIVSFGNTCEAITLYTGVIPVSQRSTACWKLVDGAGNITLSQSEIKVDKTAPSINAGLDKITNAQFTQDATASDGASGVATYLWGKVSGPVGGTITFGTPNAEDTTISADTNGEYVISLTVTDNAGNSASDEMTLTWDTVAPTAEITSPIEGQIIRDGSGQVSLGFNANDLNEITCFYKIDGGSENQITDCISPATITVLDHRHTITLIVYDQANNQSSDSVSILMDTDSNFTVDDTPGTNPDFATIQDALANALDNYTISIANGNYTLTSTLNLTLTGLTISGESESGVVINASTVSGYGIAPSADGITLEDFTLIGPAADVSSSYGIKASHISGFIASNVTVQGSGRSEFDLNTVSNGLLENITAKGENTKGVGVALSHSDNIILKNITTQENNWGGVGLFDTASGQTTNVTFEGANTFGEANSIYVDAEYGFGVSNIKLTGEFGYAVLNTTFRDGEGAGRSEDFIFYQKTLADAVAFALSLQTVPFPVNDDSYIQTLGTDVSGYVYLENNFKVSNGMDIQTAIDAAASGATINVAAGTYNESILIEKELTLAGTTGATKPIIAGVAGVSYIVKVNGIDGVVMDNLEINGGGDSTDDNTFDYGIFVNNSGSSADPIEIKNSTIKNIWKNQGKGIGAEAASYVSIHDSAISSFQKSGIRFVNSDGGFYGNEVVGDNVDGTSRVQNLVNLWTGSDVEVYDNILHNALTEPGTTPTWDSVAVFVSAYYGSYPDSGNSSANIHDNEIYNSDSGVVVGSVYAATDNSSADITANDFYNLNWAINFEKNTVSATTTGNSFNDNVIAVNAEDAVGPIVGPIVNAEGNWWGSIEGPTHADNPFGDGDIIANNNVDYRPWCMDVDCSTLDNTPPTAILSNTPTNPTSQTDADITVNNGDVVFYKYMMDGGIYGAETLVATHITLSGLTDGSYTISVIGRDQAGNWQSVATAYTWEVDTTDPTLTSVSIASDNVNPIWAKVGDTITLTIVANENIQTPTVTIAGYAATVIAGIDGQHWTASYQMASGDTEAAITFTINFTDIAGNDGALVSAVTDTSSVTFDKTAPVVAIGDPIDGDKVNGNKIITFADNGASPECSIDEENWITCGSGITALSSITGFDALPEGSFILYLQDIDPAGNIGSDSVSPIKDTVSPTVVSFTPLNNAVGIDPTGNITAIFSEIVVITDSDVELKKDGSVDSVTLSVSFIDATKQATIDPSVSLDNNSKYNVKIKTSVVDSAGNALAVEKTWSFTTAASYSIELKTGWNLISLPVTPTTWASTTDVLASVNGNVERVWTYNAVNETWSVYNASGAPGDLNIMTAGHGYWVKMTGDDTLTGVGTLYEQLVPSGDTPPSQLPEVPLAEGWNLIGYYQLPGQTDRPIANALSKLTGAWSGSGSDLITFVKATLQAITPVSTMEPGKGYWIFMTSDRKYSFGN